MQTIAFSILNFFQWCLGGIARRALPEFHHRAFSNRILRQHLRHLGGDIVNVSGWEDRDKEGGFYRQYYGWLNRYVITNIGGESGMPAEIPEDVESVYLDLEQPVPAELIGQFDVVFSHTVLEHVYTTQQALENLALLSRDVVVTVIPFSQGVHYTSSFSDYVRLSPFYLKRFFEERGFTVLLSTCNDQPFFPIYLVFVATLCPEKHVESFSDAPVSYEVQILPSRLGRFGESGLMSTGPALKEQETAHPIGQ